MSIDKLEYNTWYKPAWKPLQESNLHTAGTLRKDYYTPMEGIEWTHGGKQQPASASGTVPSTPSGTATSSKPAEKKKKWSDDGDEPEAKSATELPLLLVLHTHTNPNVML